MSSYSIEFTPQTISLINKHLEEVFPNEGCGFFFGNGKQSRLITEVMIVKNAKKGDQRRRFEIEPFDFVNAERYALENGLDLLGVFHSHPNHPAIPSEHDRKQALPYFSYLIVSIIDGKADNATSWRLDEETRQFYQENLIYQHNFQKPTANV